MTLHAAPLAPTLDRLATGELNLHDLIDQACDRLEREEARVQAFVPEADRRARLHAEATALTARFPDPPARPPLFGALVGVKDIFITADLPTRAGSAFDPALFQGPDAACVARLRQAGALVLGKTVTTEFAYFEPGPTTNPHRATHTPGGSSSGSAAAVAAGLCHLALGTQTIGSVVRPAAFCGIYGYKPSFGRIPTEGLIHFSRAADHVGCFTQDLDGILVAARVLVSEWREQDAPTTLVLGIPEGPYLDQAATEARASFEDTVARLQARGLEVRRVPLMADIADIASRHHQLIAAEMAAEHQQWFEAQRTQYRPRTLALIEEGRAIAPEIVANARQGQGRLRQEIHAAMAAHAIDLWLTPAALGPAPEGLASTGNPAMSLPWTHAGLPSLAIPSAWAENGLPLAIQVVAAFGADERLLTSAKAHLAELLPR